MNKQIELLLMFTLALQGTGIAAMDRAQQNSHPAERAQAIEQAEHKQEQEIKENKEAQKDVCGSPAWHAQQMAAYRVRKEHINSYLPPVLAHMVLEYEPLLTNWQEHKTLRRHADPVHCLAVLPDGRLASGSWDQTMRIWNPITGTCDVTLQRHTGAVRCLAVLPDGRLASGSVDRTVRIWQEVPCAVCRKLAQQAQIAQPAPPNQQAAPEHNNGAAAQ